MEFDKQKFFRNLLDAPAKEPFLESPERNEYLQRQVFDKLAAGEEVDLTTLDWTAFELRHVTLEDQSEWYETTHMGWLRGLNFRLHKTPAICFNQKVFF